ncbi:MAG TPA: hypothetical protein ACQGQX_00450, partial [Xylella taiwanensis]
EHAGQGRQSGFNGSRPPGFLQALAVDSTHRLLWHHLTVDIESSARCVNTFFPMAAIRHKILEIYIA